MLIVIACRCCGHLGLAPASVMSRLLSCRACGRRDRFSPDDQLRLRQSRPYKPRRRVLTPRLSADAVLKAASDPGVSDEELIALADAAEY